MRTRKDSCPSEHCQRKKNHGTEQPSTSHCRLYLPKYLSTRVPHSERIGSGYNKGRALKDIHRAVLDYIDTMNEGAA
jgi:hypothetical protein